MSHHFFSDFVVFFFFPPPHPQWLHFSQNSVFIGSSILGVWCTIFSELQGSCKCFWVTAINNRQQGREIGTASAVVYAHSWWWPWHFQGLLTKVKVEGLKALILSMQTCLRVWNMLWYCFSCTLQILIILFSLRWLVGLFFFPRFLNCQLLFKCWAVTFYQLRMIILTFLLSLPPCSL